MDAPSVPERLLLLLDGLYILQRCLSRRLDDVPRILRVLPDTDLASEQAVLRALGNAQIITPVVGEPADVPADLLIADKTSG